MNLAEYQKDLEKEQNIIDQIDFMKEKLEQSKKDMEGETLQMQLTKDKYQRTRIQTTSLRQEIIDKKGIKEF